MTVFILLAVAASKSFHNVAEGTLGVLKCSLSNHFPAGCVTLFHSHQFIVVKTYTSHFNELNVNYHREEFNHVQTTFVGYVEEIARLLFSARSRDNKIKK